MSSWSPVKAMSSRSPTISSLAKPWSPVERRNGHEYATTWALLLILFLGVMLDIFQDTRSSAHLCLIAASLIAMFSFSGLTAGRDLIDLRLTAPKRLYGLFFALFYATELWFYATDRSRSQDHDLLLAVIVIVAYAGWYIGMSLVERRAHVLARAPQFERRQSWALLKLCIFGALCVVVHFWWRLSIGQFYTHAHYYEQALTPADSILQNFCGPFEFPVILLSGLITASRDRRVANLSRYFAYTYTTAFVVTEILASEFRNSLLAMVFLAAAMQTAGTLKIRWRHLILATIVAVFGMVAVEGTRVAVTYSIPGAENQLVQSAASMGAGLQLFLGSGSAVAKNATAARAADPMGFLTEIIDAFDRGKPHLYGQIELNSLYMFIPRLFWTSKPKVESSQILIERALGLTEVDASPNPALFFYADAGIVGVFTLLLCFGALFAALSRFAVTQGSVFAWMWIVWIWSVVANVETDMVLGILSATRHLLTSYCFYLIFYTFTSIQPSAHGRADQLKAAPLYPPKGRG